ncbi:MAG: DNA recombination protein RmuC [Candidatus Omnitrophica bacterium]|nr:DNA recombination protein RmuC [Candidatus Omnitrophota bacterium]
MIVLTISIILIGFCISVIFLIFKIFSLTSGRLEAMNQSLQKLSDSILLNMGNATNIFGNVQKTLGALEESNRQIMQISQDIAKLQELLRAPKLRGQIGETLLERLLAQVLPQNFYHLQHRFSNGEVVDAVIVIGERLVPVDAKFSLENFLKFTEATDELQRQQFRKKFIQDIKNRIGEISSKYILPAENTYDFALMYIPAENVYYEVIIKEEIFSYSLQHHVIPVSANTFYAYLQVICLGLRGLKIEENAKEILKNLNTLSMELKKFKEDFDLVGRHIQSAWTKFQESSHRFERVSDRLLLMQQTKQLENTTVKNEQL